MENRSKIGWESFQEFIEVANKNCNWLVLRNFEYLPNNFFGNDKDVDILCENLEYFTKTMKLKKRSWGIGAYETIIDNQVVPFDVRFLGDGYYDKLWQYKMLKNKTFTSDGVPRMNDEDYFYSLIYHSKIQKYEVKEVYKTRLNNLAISLDISSYNICSIDDDRYVSKLLSDFMRKNYYNYTTPMDINVPKNIAFFNLLDSYVKNGVTFKIPRKIKFLQYLPNGIFKIIPRSIKDTIKKVLKWD